MQKEPENGFNHKVSRRTLLNLGWSSAIAMCMSSMAGCARRKEPSPTAAAAGSRKGFVRPTRSPWFSPDSDGNIRCQLCPNQCNLAPSTRGICGVRENRNQHMYTLAYGNPVLLQDDPVERNPFFHVRPGTRSLSLSTAGCNLNCQFCEVWDTALVKPEEVYAHDMPPQRIVEHAQATNVSAVCYSLGEPVVFYEYMVAIANLAKQAGLLNLMQTAGYIQSTPLAKLCPYLDGINIDLKGFDPGFYRRAVGGELAPVLATLKQVRAAGVHLEITNLLIPTLNDDMQSIEAMCRWIVEELGPDVPLHFSRFYPLFQLIDLPRTPISTMDRARETALKAGLKFVYVARVPGHEGENTFCPNCNRRIIVREGFIVDEMRIENNKCRFCRTTIPGNFT